MCETDGIALKLQFLFFVGVVNLQSDYLGLVPTTFLEDGYFSPFLKIPIDESGI
jgi:hypothetical protein